MKRIKVKLNLASSKSDIALRIIFLPQPLPTRPTNHPPQFDDTSQSTHAAISAAVVY